MTEPKDSCDDVADSAAASDQDENEVLRASRLARSLRDKAAEKAGNMGWKTAAGIGVGSAALLAALLYARSGRK